MSYDNLLIQKVFGSNCIDKSRLPASSIGSFGIPSFVGEWLLHKVAPGNGPLTIEEQDRLQGFVQKAFPHKDDKEVITFRLTQGEMKSLIVQMLVRVHIDHEKGEIPDPTAKIPLLGYDDCFIPVDLVEKNLHLLRQGVWGKVTLRMNPKGKVEVVAFDPFQCSAVDLRMYAEFQNEISNSEQWRDLMVCSMGFNAQHPALTREAKTWVLARLLPLVVQNFHCMELAPKGTGKSFFFENISNKISLVSGGKVTPARLFIDGRTKEVGMLGKYDVVVLDEVQSLTFDNPDELIGPLKNYLANGRYNRAGFSDISSDCSLVMLANIELDEFLQPRSEKNLLIDLPRFFHETAFLDRFAGIIPGWKIPKFQKEMIATQVGLKMDFFGEVLLALRRDGRYLDFAKRHIKFGSEVTIRDQNAIEKSASGFLKILYPSLNLSTEDFRRDCLEPALELRQAIRTTQYFLDDEYRQLGKTIGVEVIS